MQGKYVVYSVRNNPEPREGTTASSDVSGATGGVVHQASRRIPRADNARSISGNRKLGRCSAGLWREKIYRVRDRRDLSRGSEATPFFVGEAVCFRRDANGVPYSSVPSFGGELDENFSSDFTKFPGSGQTRSKIRSASGLAVR